MVTCGFPRVALAADLRVAALLGVDRVEILPNWRDHPPAADVRRQVEGAGLVAQSVHGGWGGQAIAAGRIDLGSLDPAIRRESVADLLRCLDWAAGVGAGHLIVHPGVLSDPADGPSRSGALLDSLAELADRAGGGPLICVENMPPGVHPGSDLGELAGLLDRLGRPEVGLIVDTGHARMVDSPEAQTTRAGARLRATHVHDNDGRQDSHEIPGRGVIDWGAWLASLDAIGYGGALMLECIRKLRDLDEVGLEALGRELKGLLRGA